MKMGEELLKTASKSMRDAAGPDAWQQGYEVIMGFINAVDWNERWIQCLCAGHATILVVALLTRKSEMAQMVLFLSCMCLAFAAEPINRVRRRGSPGLKQTALLAAPTL